MVWMAYSSYKQNSAMYDIDLTLFFLPVENCLLPTEVRKDALQLQKLLEYDDGGAEG